MDKEINASRTIDVLTEVAVERANQDTKFGEQNHLLQKWFVILGEEVGEVARAVYEGDIRNTREELIQVAAVAVATIECIDRKYGNHRESN